MKYLLANWKMYLSVDESIALVKKIADFDVPKDKKLILFPSALAFTDVQNAVGKKIDVGAQDGHFEMAAAETGEVSMKDVKDAGAAYVLVGHSELRADCDTDEIVAKKLASAVDAGLIPVLCVGETKEELGSVGRGQRLRDQLDSALRGVELKKLFVAYEPVWAVGSGDEASKEDVEEAADVIQKVVGHTHPDTKIVILYGGSVEPKNVAQYTGISGVSGVLVGGDSTKIGSLRGILRAL